MIEAIRSIVKGAESVWDTVDVLLVVALEELDRRELFMVSVHVDAALQLYRTAFEEQRGPARRRGIPPGH